MERIILIKYGEMTTKKGNRNFFVKTLATNLEQKLKDYPCTLEKDMARMYLSYDEREEQEILECHPYCFWNPHLSHRVYL